MAPFRGQSQPRASLTRLAAHAARHPPLDPARANLEAFRIEITHILRD